MGPHLRFNLEYTKNVLSTVLANIVLREVFSLRELTVRHNSSTVHLIVYRRGGGGGGFKGKLLLIVHERNTFILSKLVG